MIFEFKTLLDSLRQTSEITTTETDAELEYVEENYEKAVQKEDIKLRRENLELAKQNRAERKKYARHIFIVTCVWASLIFIIVIANGLKEISNNKFFVFSISDNVMITLITSTTINFFGFFLLVVKYLFQTTIPDKSEKIKVASTRTKRTPKAPPEQ